MEGQEMVGDVHEEGAGEAAGAVRAAPLTPSQELAEQYRLPEGGYDVEALAAEMGQYLEAQADRFTPGVVANIAHNLSVELVMALADTVGQYLGAITQQAEVHQEIVQMMGRLATYEQVATAYDILKGAEDGEA